MLLFNKISMTFNKKDFEIRVLYNDTTINVVAFLNNHPANGFRYQIQIPKQIDIKEILETDAVKELVKKSQSDIIEKRWEKLLKEVG